jgi:hypothetical protein
MNRPCTQRAQRGQTVVEYVVVAAAMVSALFVIDVTTDGKTAAQFLADSIRAFFRGLTYFISLP